MVMHILTILAVVALVGIILVAITDTGSRWEKLGGYLVSIGLIGLGAYVIGVAVFKLASI